MKYTPLKLNAMGSLLQNSGLNINTTAVEYMGTSTSLSTYSQGTVTTSTVLGRLVNAIRLAYTKINAGISQTTYNNLISIGSTTIPALGNSKPSTYTRSYTGELTSYGFLRLIPYQAYNELYLTDGTYKKFLASFNACESKKTQLNSVIEALNNSVNFLDGIYSNMNDLITADITGVTLSTFYWGQDLIASGRAIDLSTINTFGSPINLLRTLSRNNAITKSINIALLSVGLNGDDVQNLINGQEPTDEQQRYLYGAFSIIVGADLEDVLIPLNCQTPNLNSLVDLLDVKKLFPNSYTTLTYPQYNSVPLATNSKTYYLIFQGNQANINPQTGLGERLKNIIPADIAFTADAFGMAMSQIRNINSVSIEKFSQVVMNLENISGLTNVNGTATPTNNSLSESSLNVLAKGSNTNGTYNTCDFFGSMTNIHYDWNQLQSLLSSTQTQTLIDIYTNILNLLSGGGPYTALDTFITQANTEIANILSTNSVQATELNTLYNTFGRYLQKEQDARELVLPANLTNFIATDTDTVTFIDILGQYATDTTTKGSARVLENIANTTVQGGNYLIAAMRESRNGERLGLAGIELDNDVNESQYKLPRPTGLTLAQQPIDGYVNSAALANVPIITGAATTPGSLGGSTETTLVPDNLSILVQPNAESVLTQNQALEEVITCNCDCWDLIQ